MNNKLLGVGLRAKVRYFPFRIQNDVIVLIDCVMASGLQRFAADVPLTPPDGDQSVSVALLSGYHPEVPGRRRRRKVQMLQVLGYAASAGASDDLRAPAVRRVSRRSAWKRQHHVPGPGVR